MTGTSAGKADKAEAETVLEFFNGSQGKWIPVDIIDRDPQGAVQVSAKPGVWLSAKDCKRKLRARVYADDASIGSTITSADAFLEAAKAQESTKAPPPKPKAPIYSRHSCTGGPGGGGSDGSAGQHVGALKLGSLKQTATSGPRQVDSLRVPCVPTAGRQPVVKPSQRDSGADSGYPNQAPSPSAVSKRMTDCLDDTEERPAPVDSSATQSVRKSAPKEPRPTLASTYSCPRCGAADLPTFEEAVNHCTEQAGKSADAETATSDSATDLPPDLPTKAEAGQQRNGLRYIRTVPVATPKEQPESERREPLSVDAESRVPRPSVGGEKRVATVLSTEPKDPPPVDCVVGNVDIEEETDSTRSSECQRPAQGLVGEAIAYNIRGEPIIARAVDSESGVGLTTVVNDDGSKCVFGKNTLESLMSSGGTDAEAWISSLTTLETRGLVHEIGQVLLSTSQVYQFHLDRLKAISETAHYEFFGLSADCSDSELDRAYKKMAKQMHPDKNGGTEGAKERFQQMKERYETLKERRANGEDAGDSKKERSKDGDAEKGDKDDLDEDGNPKRKEAYDEDEDEAPKKQESSQISYDPTDQESLATTAVEMLQRLKAIEGSMSTVLSQLKKHGL